MLRRRTCCLALLLLGAALTGAAAEEAAAEGAAGAEATPTPDAAAAEAEPEETQIVLNCDDAELLEPLTTWSPDCVAQWAENMGYPQLKAAFLGNKLTGKGLEALSLETLEKEYGVADEHDRKTLAYTVKDMLRKDNYRGNTNDWQNFLLWLLPMLGVGKWLSMKYEKQLAKLMKKYRKWQEARAPPKPLNSEPVPEGETNDWIDGINADVGTDKPKSVKKRTKKAT
ncbi:hypothetical protein EMIHUDRAFT_451313, partial [Emiliania huxleyi CCMP1516]|uniref:SAM domain-containing protein n=2 Tax=Emiliania huxleyi TaxID=2903 RepID=A0A0D3J2N8_EMIH1